jgi:glucose-1-phosphate cytidylyltransferase
MEFGALQKLAADGQLEVFDHNGFWQPMDNVRERDNLEKLWASGNAPWKVWR